jgi:hypothetical protein
MHQRRGAAFVVREKVRPCGAALVSAALARLGNGGGGGNRTRVPECLDLSFYARSSLFVVIHTAPTNRISADQLDCFSLRLGRVASQQPACCVAPWPPADKGTSASRLVIKQRGSSACWHLSFSSRIYEVPGPRRATSGRINIRSKPIAPRLTLTLSGMFGSSTRAARDPCLRLHSQDPLSEVRTEPDAPKRAPPKCSPQTRSAIHRHGLYPDDCCWAGRRNAG